MTINEALNILGLSRGCSEAEIKRAFRQLAKKYHPDIVGDQYRNKFISVNDAYTVLTEQGTTEGCKLTHTSIFNFKRN